MVFKHLSYILLFSNLIQSYSEKNKESLKLVQIITRHGDKNPPKPYPTDPYGDESNWPGGYNQLTDEGKLRMYNVGRYLRDQYDGVVDTSYNPKDVYVLSSDYDRTIRSAMALLAGLYRESNLNSTWNPDHITWDPIPVHTVDKEHDRIFEVTESCPKLDEIFNYMFTESDYAKWLLSEENKETLNFLSENSGIDFSEDLPSLGSLFLTLKIQKDQFNLELPSWTDSYFNSEILGDNFPENFYIEGFNTRLDWLRLRVGPLLSNFISNMEEVVSGVQETIPMRLWMSHDIFLSSFIAALNLYDQSKLPTYGSSIILELHERRDQQNSSVEYFVEIYIKNDTTANNPVGAAIPECPAPCSLEKFKIFTKKLIPDDWGKECLEKMEINAQVKQNQNAGISIRKNSNFTTVILLIATVTCFTSVIYIYQRQTRHKITPYEKL